MLATAMDFQKVVETIRARSGYCSDLPAVGGIMNFAQLASAALVELREAGALDLCRGHNDAPPPRQIAGLIERFWGLAGGYVALPPRRDARVSLVELWLRWDLVDKETLLELAKTRPSVFDARTLPDGRFLHAYWD